MVFRVRIAVKHQPADAQMLGKAHWEPMEVEFEVAARDSAHLQEKLSGMLERASSDAKHGGFGGHEP